MAYNIFPPVNLCRRKRSNRNATYRRLENNVKAIKKKKDCRFYIVYVNYFSIFGRG